MTFTNNDKKAMWWIIAPSVIGAIALLFIFLSSAEEGSNPMLIAGIVSFVAILAFLIGIIMATRYLRQEKEMLVATFSTKEVYNKLTAEQQFFIKGNTWAAFFNSFIWALGNKLPLWALGSIVPFWGFYAWLRLIILGRTMAWERGGWENFEQFKKRQKLMMWIVIIVIVVTIALGFIG